MPGDALGSKGEERFAGECYMSPQGAKWATVCSKSVGTSAGFNSRYILRSLTLSKTWIFDVRLQLPVQWHAICIVQVARKPPLTLIVLRTVHDGGLTTCEDGGG